MTHPEANVIEGIGGKDYRCPNCDGHLFPEGEDTDLWNCSRCPFGPYSKPEGV